LAEIGGRRRRNQSISRPLYCLPLWCGRTGGRRRRPAGSRARSAPCARDRPAAVACLLCSAFPLPPRRAPIDDPAGCSVRPAGLGAVRQAASKNLPSTSLSLWLVLVLGRRAAVSLGEGARRERKARMERRPVRWPRSCFVSLSCSGWGEWGGVG
jgi:hypothetical protein